jgi:mannose-6-phosphate isomerase-like protein (cupin superfamily)
VLFSRGDDPPTPDKQVEHLHHGEEILRILAGEAVVQVGDEQRHCGPGKVNDPAG